MRRYLVLSILIVWNFNTKCVKLLLIVVHLIYVIFKPFMYEYLYPFLRPLILVFSAVKQDIFLVSNIAFVFFLRFRDFADVYSVFSEFYDLLVYWSLGLYSFMMSSMMTLSDSKYIHFPYSFFPLPCHVFISLIHPCFETVLAELWMYIVLQRVASPTC